MQNQLLIGLIAVAMLSAMIVSATASQKSYTQYNRIKRSHYHQHEFSGHSWKRMFLFFSKTTCHRCGQSTRKIACYSTGSSTNSGEAQRSD